jgi:hypothetical protein
MSVQVPAEMPLGRAVRYAVHNDGATCTTNAAASSVPRPTRPATPQTKESRCNPITTRLHRALSPDSRFQLVNVAHWESLEAYLAATADAEFQQRVTAAAADRQALIATYPALYQVVVEFSEPGGI